ncbi:hypothetical protein IQ07DRAFT_69561 [Pyrenochaeta sp. DS3sAY3a]|nr:hypothetical protein IQ07DRAFT_69561 [Pyrenochaeta sp. DS3sAY3a]
MCPRLHSMDLIALHLNGDERIHDTAGQTELIASLVCLVYCATSSSAGIGVAINAWVVNAWIAA